MIVKIFNLLSIIILLGCEFRPPLHQFEALELKQTRCYYPVNEIHRYNEEDSSTITECYYTSTQAVKEELIFDADTTILIGMVTYQYKHTYYLKTVYDYVNGSQENHYVTGIYYMDKN